MAPKAEKKPAQPAKMAVAKKSSAGRKKGSKKAVESYKIYIYKVCGMVAVYACSYVAFPYGLSVNFENAEARFAQELKCFKSSAGLEAGPPGHRHLFQGHVHPQLFHR